MVKGVTMWPTIFPVSNFREFRGFSNVSRKEEPVKLNSSKKKKKKIGKSYFIYSDRWI